MCCLFLLLLSLGPRFAILAMWLFGNRVDFAFGSWVWPLLGLLVAPWTTLMWLVVFPGGIEGLDYLWLGFAVAFDLFTWFGGGYTNRNRMPTRAA